MIKVNEHELGTCDMVDDFEQSFLASCDFNKVDPENMEYFRRYVWNVLAMTIIRINKIEDKTDPDIPVGVTCH